ncbi:MAG TPA: hypothetical protein VEK08_07720 [Planctomycetota bacterium]|nr:hypothetical protein [Planctomycetota bacterium]
MPTLTAESVRCKRCATILRNRKVCPCCSWDSTAPAETPDVSVEKSGAAAKPERQRAPRPSMKLCPVCVSSIPEAELVEVEGQRVCAACAEHLKKTGGSVPRPAAPAAAKAAAPAGSATATSATPEPAAAPPAQASAGGSNPNWMEEQLKSKLMVTKVILVINALILLASGVFAWLGSSLVSSIGQGMDKFGDTPEMRAMLKKDLEEGLKYELGRDPTKAEVQAAEDKMAAERQKARDQMEHEAFKLKLISALTLFIGVGLFGLLFFMNSYPFECCLTALILYSIDAVVGFITSDEMGMFTIAIKVSIIASLLAAAQAGHQIKTLRKERGETV